MSIKNINPMVFAAIAAREDEANEAGWTHDELWGDRFWNITAGKNRPGLVSMLRPGDQLGEITADKIQILRKWGCYTLHFRSHRPTGTAA